MTLGMKTMSSTNRPANRVRTTQGAIESIMLGISPRNDIKNYAIQRRIELENIITAIARRSGPGQDMSQDLHPGKWSKQVTLWRPRIRKRNIGRPQRRWTDYIKERAGKRLYQTKHNGKI